jgi:hypothetical protein
VAVLLTVVVCGSGCAVGGGRDIVIRQSAPGVVSPTPGPVRTIVRSGPVVAAGRTATVQAQAGVALRLTASRPSVSRTRLSSSYGYPPAHGFYVTFRLTVVNTGTRPVRLGPKDFVVAIAGQGTVTSYDGNAPYSGASSQLDNTELEPGDRIHAPLTFDVRTPHGRLAFKPDRTRAVTWRF